MRDDAFRARRVNAAGLALVLALHALAAGWLWSQRPMPPTAEAAALFVDFIAPPAVEANERPKPAPRNRRAPGKMAPRLLAVEAATTSAAEIAAPPAPTPVVAVPVEPKPTGPVTLNAELAVSCTERMPPAYPSLSRRYSEEGTVALRVELDEQGLVATARVASGSGHSRLDSAALTAVRAWRCTPAQRDGQPVRAVALQAFQFILQGH
ncbi:MAG: energy transducer TonB [Sulfuritalea sp.]|nr:energy transducer TonB [Sulfuritalea sp.]